MKECRGDGSPQDWIIWSKDERSKMTEPDEKSWTARPDVALRGCTRQDKDTSFLSELVDLRLSRYTKKFQLPSCWIPGPDVYTDIRHRLRNQDSDGGVFLMTNSTAYSYYADRVLVARELMGHIGWSHHVKTENLRRAIPNWPDTKKKAKPKAKAQDEMFPPPQQKKRKQPLVRRSGQQGLLSDLAGNAMGLPSIDLVVYSGQLSIKSPMWSEEAPSLAELHEMLGGAAHGQDSLVLDPNLSSQEIQRVFDNDEGSDGGNSIFGMGDEEDEGED